MMRLVRKAIRHDHRLRRIRQPLFDLIEAQDAIDRGDIQGAIPIGYADRHLKAAGDRKDLISALIAVAVHHGIDVTFAHAANEHCAVLPQSHSSGIGNFVRVDRDGKPRGELNLL